MTFALVSFVEGRWRFEGFTLPRLDPMNPAQATHEEQARAMLEALDDEYGTGVTRMIDLEDGDQ